MSTQRYLSTFFVIPFYHLDICFHLISLKRALSEIEKFERSLKRVLLRGRGGEIAGVLVFLFLYWFCFCACVIVFFGNVERLLLRDRGGEVAAFFGFSPLWVFKCALLRDSRVLKKFS